MESLDHAVSSAAADNRNLITRAVILGDGFSDEHVDVRLQRGSWQRAHAGVYLLGAASLDWRGRLLAAALAAGDGSAAAYRAGIVAWGLDGLRSAPIELTVPYTHGPVPEGVIVHRSRRPIESVMVDGVPVTPIERTLVDAASCLPWLVVEKAMESAVRRQLTTPARIEQFLAEECGRGVRGTRKLKRIMADRPAGGPAGSGGEVELLHVVRRMGVEPPVRQFVIALPDGSRAIIDMAWPRRRKLVELDGLDTHGSADALDNDLERQNTLLDLGWELRRWSGRAVRRRPHEVAARIVAFLAA